MTEDVGDPMEIPPIEEPDNSSMGEEPPPVTSSEDTEEEVPAIQEESTEDQKTFGEQEKFRTYHQQSERLVAFFERNKSLSKEELCFRCVQKLPSIFRANKASIYTYEEENNILTLVDHNHRSEINQKIWVAEDNSSIMEHAIAEEEIIFIEDIEDFAEEEEITLSNTFANKYETKTCISIPLVYDDEILGIFNISDPEEKEMFSREIHLPLARLLQLVLGTLMKKEQFQEELEQSTQKDSLTQVQNYRTFQQELQKEVLRAKRYTRPLSLVLMDFEEFQEINEEFGFDAGDYYLRESAKKIKQHIRTVDVLARYGGDEFVVLMPETDRKKAREAAERWRQLLAQSKFEWDGNHLHRDLQVGIAQLQEDQTIPEFLDEAEQAVTS